MSDDLKDTAAGTLDNIREGGIKLLSVIRQRHAEIDHLLDSGRFDLAHDRCIEMMQKLAILSQAEVMLGQLTRQHIVRARDIEEGMTLNDGTVVTGKEMPPHECAIPGHEVVTLRWDGGEHTYGADQELLVRPTEE